VAVQLRVATALGGSVVQATSFMGTHQLVAGQEGASVRKVCVVCVVGKHIC